MKMSELILAIGDDKVEMQNLDHCSITLDYHIKKGTRITFGTEQPLTPNGTDKLGLILWLPRDAVKAALDAEKAKPK
jgi:hypothetical protein